MKYLFFLLLTYSLFGSGSVDKLKKDLDAIVARAETSAHVGIKVVSLKNHQTLYEKNADKLFIPASNLKLFTGAAALAVLGVDFRFDTRLLVDSAGNLYLKGSGDPSLTRYDLEELVRQLKMQQIKEVQNIIVDNSAFDEVSQGPGWMWDEPAEFWNSPMDAITVDHNVMNIWVVPSHAPYTILDPPLKELIVDNRVQVGKEVDLKAERKPIPGEKLVCVEGTIPPAAKPVELKVTIPSPPRFAGELLLSLLQKAGIIVHGTVASASTPETADVLAIHSSAPLADIVLMMMKESDNLYSDCLFKKVGEVCFGSPGTWQKGSLALREFLKKDVGIDITKMVLLDGSGLSRYNLVSPQNFIAFLSWVKDQFAFAPEFLSSLPIARVDGSLRHRMLSAKNKIRAKTGSMTGITGISGYARRAMASCLPSQSS